MRYLITGSSGHLGEAIVKTLRNDGRDAVSIDVKPGAFTDHVGSIVDQAFVSQCCNGVDVIIHAATLHKPHVATHSRQDFINVNITGTQNLLSAAIANGVNAFIFTGTTSAFGAALSPPRGAPAAWITEDVRPVTKNIYGATKLAAEDLCWLAHRKDKLPCIILRTSRFFPEEQDSADIRAKYSAANSQAVEFLHRRVDIEDVVSAHLLAAEKAPEIGFGKYIISATSPFRQEDLADLRGNGAAVVRRYVDYDDVFKALGWSMYEDFDRVYVNEKARKELGWRPRYDFAHVVSRLRDGKRPLSALADSIGVKGYHDEKFEDGPFPVEP